MKIPIRYNLRSLWVRKVGTMMTAVGIGLTVAVLVVLMALVSGLDSTFVDTGHEDHLVILRKGSQNEINSYFGRDLYQQIRFLEGVARDAENEPWAVGEIVVVINYERLAGDSSNVMFRGTGDRGFEMRPEIEMLEGRKFKKGVREVVVSSSLSNRFKDMKIGDTLSIANSEWKVVGIFDAGGTAYNSEIWGAAEALTTRIDEDRRIQLQAISQVDYYNQQTLSSVGVKALGVFIAVVMGIGSCFAAANMMYGTVLARFKEVGTLRAIGFKRRSILASFLMESIVLAILGGILGCIIALPVHGISTGTTNLASFSEVLFNFRITPAILLWAVLFASLVGIIGGFLPALRAARLRLVDVLRD
jgi:putative ABC transport system permease protein